LIGIDGLLGGVLSPPGIRTPFGRLDVCAHWPEFARRASRVQDFG
jgi:hypothetical protein